MRNEEYLKEYLVYYDMNKYIISFDPAIESDEEKLNRERIEKLESLFPELKK